MSHRRSEAHDAFRGGLPKPLWLDVEEWESIQDEHQYTPDRYSQQRDVAATRLDRVGMWHLGSGRYDSMRYQFIRVGSGSSSDANRRILQISSWIGCTIARLRGMRCNCFMGEYSMIRLQV
ncbi:hypothetical protein KP509_22G035200 [Ceratopteris richardii]|uniref:Uncharacterized protein n=1 Tax=Ceratopteris richardii TaxID=49495 RepID=A0A8T2S6P5_CERRI|nr:hypothetical protein KP509_22G035200 [Ceratopteris richardii]